VHRRSFLIGLLSVVGVPLVAEAQHRNIPRVGVISAITRDAQLPWADGFREGLQALGYVDGQNITIEWRYADGRAERFHELAEDLARLKVDVIVPANQPAVEAAQRVTRVKS